jgi:4-hydroxybenzoate polyprenyltransferase/phosphoserine phosphatase
MSSLTVPDYMPEVPKSLGASVLFVDLDGTLIASDLLWESLFLAIKKSPLLVFMIPLWLLQGRARLKRKLAERGCPDVRSLPFHEGVLDLLKEKRAAGWTLVLATAADQLLAGKVAAELGIFEGVLCSRGVNLKGQAKLQAIRAYCSNYGVTEFAYIGDASADLAIWKHAQQIYVVCPCRSLLVRLGRLGKSVQVVGRRNSSLVAAWQALRPHHWVKNLLLAVPLVLAHQITAPGKAIALLFAFVAFSACASSVYVLNDLLDIEADRRHPTKRHRPFASGAVPLAVGPYLIVGLVALGFLISLAALPLDYAALLGVYLVVNYLYTCWLKEKIMIDVLTLAGLYSLRVLAGGIAVDVVVSEWLLVFSMFFFLSLAFAKRYSELCLLSRGGEARGRGYVTSDISLIESIGPSSGYLAVLVLALYINGNQVKTLYVNPAPLWLCCPLLLYWIGRVWFLAKRGILTEDPIVFAIMDRVSVVTGCLALMLLALGRWHF